MKPFRFVFFLSFLCIFAASMPPSKAAAQTFSDVPSDSWSYQYVVDTVNKGFFDNKPLFYPQKNLNRAEMAKLVCKVALTVGIIPGYDTTNAPTFADVHPDDWFYLYAATAAKYNLMTGYRDANGNLTGRFGPADRVTRAQAAKAFISAAAIPLIKIPPAPLSDLESVPWAADFIHTAFNKGIMVGYDDNRFGVNDPVTREQIAKVISKIFEKR